MAGHRLMMIACGIPMLLIAGVSVATGVVGVGLLLVAVAMPTGSRQQWNRTRRFNTLRPG